MFWGGDDVGNVDEFCCNDLGGFIFNLMLVLPFCSLCFPSNGWVFGFSTTDVLGLFFCCLKRPQGCA